MRLRLAAVPRGRSNGLNGGGGRARRALRRTPRRAHRLRRSADGIVRMTLSNGLRIVAKEMHAAPVASLFVWYQVGSRNEHVGMTGASHWVEHMLFKGTRSYSADDIDRLISANGGVHNASTSMDFTTYYATLPSDKIDLVIALEADRMVNARFDPREVERERTVLINERQMYENSPGFRLVEEVQAAAFRVHPYGHEVIGHLCDLQAMSRDDLYAHYRTYYRPDNAVIAVVGDFDAREMLAKIEQRYGRLKSAHEPIPAPTATEPPQHGERRIVVKGEGDTHYLTLAFRAPPATHEDYMALTALNAVLHGAAGVTNRSSRLHKALVDTGYAADIGGTLTATIDPFIYRLRATVMPGKTPDEVERRLWDELENIKHSPVTRAELDKVIKQARTEMAFSTESATEQAFWLGFSETIADYTWFMTFVDRLMRVSPEDIQRVANQYLTRDGVTVGHYLAQGR